MTIDNCGIILLYMSTAERLTHYYDFDETVLERAEEVAERQQALTWQEFLRDCNMQADPERYLVDRRSTEWIEFRPTGDFDATKARMFHGPMANPLDPNIAYQAATVFALDPTTRLFAVANPSGPGRDAGLMSHLERKRIADGDLTPTVEPALRLLARAGVESVVHIGGSYGAEKSLVAAQHADRFDHEAKAVVAIEPPAVIKRNVLSLGAAFMKTNAHLSEYVTASGVEAFDAARRQSVGALEYPVGLLRLTNLAVAKGLTHNLFRERATAALAAEPGLTATIAWGSNSELALDQNVSQDTGALEDQFGTERVQRIRLVGQYHALLNDIHLQAAIALQAEHRSIES